MARIGNSPGDGRELAVGVSALLALDLIGGAVAVRSGVNRPSEAWSGKATLAAPLPMMAAQSVLAVAAIRRRGRIAAAASGLLAVACAVSGVSGFFDGQLGRRGLPALLVGFQVLLVAATLVVGVLAAARSIRLLRDPVG